ncbi:unnamed protein product, partial [Prorocentrum cordatum]
VHHRPPLCEAAEHQARHGEAAALVAGVPAAPAPGAGRGGEALRARRAGTAEAGAAGRGPARAVPPPRGAALARGWPPLLGWPRVVPLALREGRGPRPGACAERLRAASAALRVAERCACAWRRASAEARRGHAVHPGRGRVAAGGVGHRLRILHRVGAGPADVAARGRPVAAPRLPTPPLGPRRPRPGAGHACRLADGVRRPRPRRGPAGSRWPGAPGPRARGERPGLRPRWGGGGGLGPLRAAARRPGPRAVGGALARGAGASVRAGSRRRGAGAAPAGGGPPAPLESAAGCQRRPVAGERPGKASRCPAGSPRVSFFLECVAGLATARLSAALPPRAASAGRVPAVHTAGGRSEEEKRLPHSRSLFFFFSLSLSLSLSP